MRASMLRFDARAGAAPRKAEAKVGTIAACRAPQRRNAEDTGASAHTMSKQTHTHTNMHLHALVHVSMLSGEIEQCTTTGETKKQTNLAHNMRMTTKAANEGRASKRVPQPFVCIRR